MRIGIAAENGMGLQAKVSQHFGRCSHYVIVDVDGDTIKEVTTINNPFFSAHESPGQVPSFIRDQGIDVIISGGMGGQAIGFFMGFGIQTVTRAMGSVQESLDNYLAGSSSDSTRFIS